MIEGLTALAAILIVSTVFALIARAFNQPIVIAYLFSGAVVALFAGVSEGSQDLFAFFSELGIMFLLFLVGLEMNYESIRSVGKDAVLVGIGQTVFTLVIGWLVAAVFGYDLLSSFYIPQLF